MSTREYPPEIRDSVLERLRGGESLRKICRDGDMPDRETVRLWQRDDQEWNLAVTRAREEGYQARAEQAVIDAKDAKDAALGRLAFDAERWYLGKLSNAFADKVVVQGDPEKPLKHEHGVKIDYSGAPEDVIRWIASQQAG